MKAVESVAVGKKVALVYGDVFLTHRMPPHHPESPGRLEALMSELRSAEVWEEISLVEPRKASLEDVAKVHDMRYVRQVQEMGSGYLDPDTYVSEGSCEAALYAAGAVMTAIDGVVEGRWRRAFCAVRPPGHHAERARGMGFCLFNNVAVGARYAQSRGLPRVMIADFDVHHGNGTQDIFYRDPTVFYFSTHQFPHYPGSGTAGECGEGKGKGYTLNIPLPAGAGDDELQRAYGEAFTEASSLFKADCILVSAGYDLLSADPLAGMNVTHRGLRKVIEAIVRASGGVPIVFALEGGYDLRGLSQGVRESVEILASD
jgi:acetoin utilization deacetylase AcuC-like enzyme